MADKKASIVSNSENLHRINEGLLRTNRSGAAMDMFESVYEAYVSWNCSATIAQNRSVCQREIKEAENRQNVPDDDDDE